MKRLRNLKIILLIIFIMLGFLNVSGQERELIYKYDNSSRKDLENGEEQFRIRMSASYQIFTNVDTFENVRSDGEIIKWRINGMSDYKINRIGEGVRFEETYDINSDSFTVEYYLPDDVEMILDDDTTKFIKNGKVIYRNMGMSIFNDGIKLNKTKTKLYKNKLKVRFNRPDKSKKAKVDPIWSWQPTETDGIDCYMQSNTATTNYNDKFLHASAGAASFHMRPLIKFSALTDSIPADATITSAFLYMTNRGINTEVSVDSMTSYVLKRVFVETQATYNIFSTGNNWGTSGATNVSDIYYAPADTNFNIGGTTKGSGALDTLDITNTTKLLVGVDSVYANNGIMIRGLNDITRTANAYWLSSDSSGSEPVIVINYIIIPLDTNVYIGMLNDSMNVLRAEFMNIAAVIESLATKTTFLNLSDSSGNLDAVGDSIFAYLPKPVDTTGLMLHYALDDTVIFDNSIHRNNGIRSGTIHISDFDSLGGGYGAEYFDSTSTIAVSDTNACEVDTSDFAFSCWIQLPNSPVGTSYIFHNQSLIQPQKGYYIVITNSTIKTNLDWGNSNLFVNFNGTNIADGLYHHIVINYDRDGYATLYLDEKVDGTPIDISSADSTLTQEDDPYYPLFGGAVWGGNNGALKAILDEGYVYKRLLTIDEIYNLRRNSSYYSQQMERLRKKTIPIIY